MTDEGGGAESAPSTPSDDALDHWGLFLVDCFADRWGTQRRPQALVWFELDSDSAGSDLGRAQAVAARP